MIIHQQKEGVMKNGIFSTAVLILFVCGLCLSAFPQAKDVPLKYQRHPVNPKTFFPIGNTSLSLKIEPPPGEWTLPALKSKYPLYTMLKIGDKARLLILDRNEAGDRFFNRLYFDTNDNSDLTDDPITTGTLQIARNDNCHINFPIIDTQIQVDGQSLPFSFYIRLSGRRLDQMEETKLTADNFGRFISSRLFSNCSYTGDITLNGTSYHILLNDKNCNGRFNDKHSLREIPLEMRLRFPLSSQGDSLYISQKVKVESLDAQACGNMLLLGDKLFRMQINTAQGKMMLTPVTKNLLPLKLSTAAERLFLHSNSGKHDIVAYRPYKTIMIPSGQYRLLAYQIIKQDEQGDLWRLCAGASQNSPQITVNQDNKAANVVEFGEPYMPQITANIMSPQDRRGFLIFNIEGKSKELITDLSHISGDQTQIPFSKVVGSTDRPVEPSYTIIKEDGEVVTQGSFRYG